MDWRSFLYSTSFPFYKSIECRNKTLYKMSTEIKITEKKENAILTASDKMVSSLELCEQINMFRKQFKEDAKELKHFTLMAKIKERINAYESMDSREQNILCSFIIKTLPNGGSKKSPIYILPDTDAKLLAASEVPQVSILVGQWIDSLKKENKAIKAENKSLKKSINETLIERLDNGERKIIKRFITNTVSASGYSGLKQAVNELNKAVTGKEYKEWLLKQLGETFDKYINGMPVKEYKKISMEADKVELELKHLLKNFYGYSRGQSIRAIKKEKAKLRTAKDAITNAYKAMRPKWYTGSFEVLVDEDSGERIFIADNDEVVVVVEPNEFEKDGKNIRYMRGTINIKDEGLFLDVTGGADALTLQTKTRDLDKVEYSLVVAFDLTTFKYKIVLTKLR